MQEVINRKRLYSSPWVNLEKVDLKLPSGKIIEHNFVDAVCNSVGGVVCKDGKLALIKNFRFCVDRFSWECPGGWIGSGDTPVDSVIKKVENELGYAVENVERLGMGNPWMGLSNKEHFYFLVNVGSKMDKRDHDFVKEVRFFTMDKVEKMVRKGEITDQSTLTGLFLAKLHKNL